jgi:hypothetical protein
LKGHGFSRAAAEMPMFDSHWSADHLVQLVLVVAAIVSIGVYLFWSLRRNVKKPWPALFVGTYIVLLLVLYLFAVLTQVSSEGFGSFPLLVFTTPWSWIAVWLLNTTGVFDSRVLGSGLTETFMFNTVVFVLPGVANSFILYFLVKRHQRIAAEDEAWEQARRNR